MRSKKTTDKETKKLTVPVNIGSDHIRGSINAPIVVVEYGDYECPYTGMAYPIVKKIMRHMVDKIYFVFRNFPLNDIHPHAQHAAEAAEAAVAQDKFWEMHDYLFEHQKALDDSHLLEHAQKVGLDIDRFKKEMSGHIYAPLINKSLKNGIDSGVEGTPTFFVNGVRYEDSWDLDTFSNVLKKNLLR
ncbi:MAG: protein-disulfide isomerase [Nitrososphaeraceae archaeon]|nr:protein-disulfide isomerase [Nitrososphaeraceae archaeon]MCD6036606.1 protein-disulfide isomerase [Nitrososphaeraceae archaeon]MDF2768943.1 protein-disulfide isomerase [Nitrososphaeraceae archaeon]